ncbi:MAG: PAS domain S-box protein [Ignavibacteriaceae bacterium]|nr:PAS domain S-box protein [Ignavibacteriaceae bacterium]
MTSNRTTLASLRIVLPYFILGILYILVSDKIVHLISDDHQIITNIQTYKGFGFILITSYFLFILIWRMLNRIETENKNFMAAQSALAEREKQFQLHFENSNDSIFLVKSDGKINAVNKAACSMFGRTEEEICSVGLEGILDLNDYRVNNILSNGFKLGDYRGELNFKRKDGSIFTGDITSTIFKDEQGNEKSNLIIRDVTERNLAEKSVMLERDFSNAILDSLPGIFYLFNRDLKYLRWNKNHERISGYSSEDMLKLSPGDFFSEEERPVVSEAIQQVFTKGYAEVEANLITKDGRSLPIAFNGTRIIYQNQECLLGVGIEMTRLKNAEKALFESKERYKRLTENAQDMIYRMALPSGKYEYVNPSSINILGYSPAEFYESPQIIRQIIHPDWREYFEQQWINLINGLMPPTYEYQIIHKSGEVRWLNQRNILIRDNNGNPIAIEGIVTDITKRKEIEESLKKTHLRLIQSLKFTEALLAAIPTPVFYKDRDGRYLGCNRMFSELMGVTSEEIKGKTVYELWPSEHAMTYHKKDLELISNPAQQVYEYKVRDKLGKDRSVIFAKDIFRDENDQVAGIVGAFLDITDRKQAEEENKIRNIELTRLFDTSLILLESLDKRKVLKNIVENAAQLIGVDTAAIYLVDNENLLLETTSPPLPENFPFEFRMAKLANHHLIAHAVLKAEPLIVEDINSVELTDEEKIIISSRNMKTLIYLPLFVEKVVKGVLILGTIDRKISLTSHQIDLCRTYSNLASLALENTLLFEESKQNITELIQTIAEKNIVTEALKESEARFRSMFRNHNAIMLLVDPNSGKIIDANLAAEKFYGYTISELCQMKISNINLLPEETVEKNLQSVVSNLNSYFNLPHILSSGEVRDVEIFSTPISVAEGTVLFSIIHDITERKKAEDKVQKSQEQLRALAARLEQIREDERIHLSRELHDNLGQNLTALKMDVAWLARKIGSTDQSLNEIISQKTKTVNDLIDNIIVNVRRISSDLRPTMLDYSALVPSLEWLMGDVSKRAELKYSFNSSVEEILVNQQTATSIFRIFQEAVTNIIRHSNAECMTMTIDEIDGKYLIQLTDDGRGITEDEISDSHSLGIIGMHERAIQFNGELTISKNKTKGTTVSLKVLKEEKDD